MLLFPKLVKFTDKIKYFLLLISTLLITNCSSLTSQHVNMANIAILLPVVPEELLANQPATQQLAIKKNYTEKYLEAVKAGLGDNLKSPIEITSYDVSTEEKLAISTANIIDNGTDIIITPPAFELTKYIINHVAGKNIITISLAAKPALANKYSYMLGHSSVRQLGQLTDYFLERDQQNFIILLPLNRESKITAKILANKIEKHKRNLLKIQFYQNNDDSIKKALLSLSEIVAKLEKNKYLIQKPVLLTSKASKPLLAQLKTLDLDQKTIIAGDQDLSNEKILNFVFTGSKQIISPPINKENYIELDQYKNFSSLQLLAYDAGTLVGNAIGTIYHKQHFLEQLNNINNFSGLSGTISIIDNIASRNYDFIWQENGEYMLFTDDLATNLSLPAN